MDPMWFLSTIISLILTAIIYGIAPWIFYLVRCSPIRKRTLKAFHITYTVIIALFFAVANSLNGDPISFAPAAIWGTLFYHINKSNLSDKGLLILNRSADESEASQSIEETPTADTEGIRYSLNTREALDEYVKQYGEIPTGEKPHRTVKLPLREKPRRETPQQQSSTLIPDTRCKFKLSLPLILAFLLFVSIVGNVYQAYTANALSNENDTLITELEGKEKSLSQITARATLYENKYEELKKEYDSKSWPLFIAETQVGWVFSDEDYYHNINCPYVQTTIEEDRYYSIHNIEFCEWLGYIKCPLCWD